MARFLIHLALTVGMALIGGFLQGCDLLEKGKGLADDAKKHLDNVKLPAVDASNIKLPKIQVHLFVNKVCEFGVGQYIGGIKKEFLHTANSKCDKYSKSRNTGCLDVIGQVMDNTSLAQKAKWSTSCEKSLSGNTEAHVTSDIKSLADSFVKKADIKSKLLKVWEEALNKAVSAYDEKTARLRLWSSIQLPQLVSGSAGLPVVLSAVSLVVAASLVAIGYRVYGRSHAGEPVLEDSDALLE